MADFAGNRLELTDPIVRSATCPDGKSQHYLHDATQPGLALRLRSGGGKSWVYLSTRPGHKGSHRITIGSALRLKVAAARKQAAILAGQRAAGTDLTQTRREQKQAAIKAAKAVTFGEMVAENGPYEIARRAEQIVNLKTELSALRRNLLAEHRHTDLRALNRRDIASAMDKLVKAGKRGAAKDLWKHSFTFFGWAVEQGYIDTNPLVGARRKRTGSRADRLDREEKGRALFDDEIVKVWNAAGKMGTFGLLARLCLLGGPRRSEPAQITWSQHVMDDRITFSPRWTKMGRHHDIPRTQLVDEVLAAAKHFERASSPLVFPGQRETPISGFTKLVNALIEQAGTAKFTLHDLRRTLRTIMNRCGYNDQIQRACVGQKAPAFDQKYNKDDGWFIRRCAFEAAHDYIAALTGGKRVADVISFHRINNPESQLERQLEERLREHRAQALAAG